MYRLICVFYLVSGCWIRSARPNEALRDELVLNEVQGLAPEPHNDRPDKLTPPESRRRAGSVRADENPQGKTPTIILILTMFLQSVQILR